MSRIALVRIPWPRWLERDRSVNFSGSVPHGCVVVPCYNEERRLDLPQFCDFVRRQQEIDLLLVDDGSRDRTGELLQRLRAEFPRRVEVLALDHNLGKAEAVRQGLLAALDTGAGYVGYLDADLAAPTVTMERLGEVLERWPEIEVAVGVRLPLLGHRIERTLLRRVLGKLGKTLAAATLGIPIRDTQCGAKVFRATPELAHLLARPFTVNWMFDVELLARYLERPAAQGLPRGTGIYELPLDRWRDVHGSKLRWTDATRALFDLGRLWVRYRLRPALGGAAPGEITEAEQVPAPQRRRAA